MARIEHIVTIPLQFAECCEECAVGRGRFDGRCARFRASPLPLSMVPLGSEAVPAKTPVWDRLDLLRPIKPGEPVLGCAAVVAQAGGHLLLLTEVWARPLLPHDLAHSAVATAAAALAGGGDGPEAMPALQAKLAAESFWLVHACFFLPGVLPGQAAELVDYRPAEPICGLEQYERAAKNGGEGRPQHATRLPIWLCHWLLQCGVSLPLRAMCMVLHGAGMQNVAIGMLLGLGHTMRIPAEDLAVVLLSDGDRMRLYPNAVQSVFGMSAAAIAEHCRPEGRCVDASGRGTKQLDTEASARAMQLVRRSFGALLSRSRPLCPACLSGAEVSMRKDHYCAIVHDGAHACSHLVIPRCPCCRTNNLYCETKDVTVQIAPEGEPKDAIARFAALFEERTPRYVRPGSTGRLQMPPVLTTSGPVWTTTCRVIDATFNTSPICNRCYPAMAASSRPRCAEWSASAFSGRGVECGCGAH